MIEFYMDCNIICYWVVYYVYILAFSSDVQCHPYLCRYLH